MKKLMTAVLAAGTALCLSSAVSAKPFDEFKNRVAGDLIKPFARDVGGLLGGADFHSARVLGFPGFDVGAVGVIQNRPGKDNRILKNGGVKTFGLPLIQAEVGLPFKTDLVARGMSAGGLKIIGGGLRYGLHKSGALLKILPDISVGVFADSFSYAFFKGTHFSADLAASFDLPMVKPFIGAGFDYTKLKVKEATNPLLIGASAIARDVRYTAGLMVSPLPVLYFFGAYSIFHGSTGMQFGLGARFGGILKD